MCFPPTFLKIDISSALQHHDWLLWRWLWCCQWKLWLHWQTPKRAETQGEWLWFLLWSPILSNPICTFCCFPHAFNRNNHLLPVFSRHLLAYLHFQVSPVYRKRQSTAPGFWSPPATSVDQSNLIRCEKSSYRGFAKITFSPKYFLFSGWACRDFSYRSKLLLQGNAFLFPKSYQILMHFVAHPTAILQLYVFSYTWRISLVAQMSLAVWPEGIWHLMNTARKW